MSREARVALLPGQDTPARLAVTLSLAGFACAVLLNIQHIAWWVIPLALATAAWRARASWSTHQLPSKPQRVTLVIVLTAATVVSMSQQNALSGLGAGATMLAAMAAAKLTETRRTRDWGIILGTAFFLLVTACLDRQALWRLPLYAAETWLLCTALRALGGGSHASTRMLVWQSGRALAWSIPLALLLFLFFPRLQGGFWALPQSEDAISGLGEEMSPGSISRLSESDEPALRVRFDGPLPPPAERYWRGPVMHDFDGYTWRRRPGLAARPPALRFSGTPYRYDVTLEPATHGVLIALELPADSGTTGAYTQYSGDYQLLSLRPLLQTRSYHLVSYTAHSDAAPLSPTLRGVDLRLPRERNPRAVALGRQLRASAADDAAFVTATLDHLKQGGFEYTLTPPKLSLDSVDEFLFDTKQGFCGHFASSFVTLMRAGTVPARVVTGYLGGEWNPMGRYLLLRQSHAHAWAEVWLEGRGWTRVDPTVAVAPERLTRDVFDLIDNAGRSAARALRSAPWLGAIIQSFEALNAWWQDSVVGFDFRKQLAILQQFGFEDRDWRAIAIVLGGGASLWLLWIAWSLRLQLDRRLARAGLPRQAHEGPLAYAKRVAAVQPALAAPLHDIARQYADLRFGAAGPASREALWKLRARIRALHLT
jgi:transglutaminase-like putative cysteine protease